MPRDATDTPDWFGPDGSLSRLHPGYEYRQEQAVMAARVAKALATGGRLLAEAGTGVGKSLAYLVPCCDWAAQTGKRVAVSTYTRVLQSQLVSQDAPLAVKMVERAPKVEAAYGQENYLCRARLSSRVTHGLFDTREEARAADELLDWAARTEDGILLDLPGAVPVRVLARVGRDSAACRGRDCPEFARCHYFRAKRRWQEAGVLVVNHALFFAGFGQDSEVLPEISAAVFDEAHRLEDAGVRHFGVQLGHARLLGLLDALAPERGRGLVQFLEPGDELRRAVEDACRACRSELDEYFDGVARLLPGNATRARIQQAVEDAPRAGLAKLAEMASALSRAVDDEQVAAEFAASGRRLAEMAAGFGRFAEPDLEADVHWVERSGSGACSLVCAPLDVAPMLRERVFDELHAVILTSATLAVAGDFAFTRTRLGLDRFEELALDSPFDYRSNCLLFVPSKLPDPTDPEYVERAARGIQRILEASRGRALVLFTSYEMLGRVRELVEPDGFEIYCQGELPVAELLRRFRDDTQSVLFATQGFWQGVDVPGESLSCLVICRLPFEVPDDPRLAAIAERLKAAGEHPFPAYQLPTAVLRFRQGFGRLIRSRSDRGVVCVLDRRIVTRSYGAAFISSLPRLPMTGRFGQVKSFLDPVRED